MLDRSGKYHTVDGVLISPNLRVFGYDMEWGNVDPANWDEGKYNHPGTHNFDGWYYVIWDSGKRDIADGSRMITKTTLSTDPNPDKVIVTQSDSDHRMAFDSEENERELWFGTPENPIL